MLQGKKTKQKQQNLSICQEASQLAVLIKFYLH